MDFEKAYEKFLNGTATEEEVAFVREEMKKAKALNDVIDKAEKNEAIRRAEKEEIKSAIKSFNFKATLKIMIISLSSLVVIAGIVLASIFIPALATAKNNLNVSKVEAKEIAIEYVKERHPETADKIVIREFERELEINGRLKKSHYVYVLDVYNGMDNSYEIEIDSKDGSILSAEID